MIPILIKIYSFLVLLVIFLGLMNVYLQLGWEGLKLVMLGAIALFMIWDVQQRISQWQN